VTRWIPFPWGKTKESRDESINVESFVESLKVSQDGYIEEEGIIYIKPVDISVESAVDDSIKEFERGNVVILDISKMVGNSDLFKKIKAIKKHCANKGGDVCRISEVKLMVLPVGFEVAYPAASEPMED